MSAGFPGDDETPEDEGEEGWDPEDDNLQKNYMKMAAKFMKEQMASLKEMKEAQAASHARPPSRGIPGLAGLLALAPATPPNASIRKIDNGFLMTYNDVKEDHGHFPTPGVLGIGGSPSQVAVSPLGAPMVSGPQYGSPHVQHGPPHVHRVEVFVKDASEALPHLQKAMDAMEKLSNMGPGAFYL